MKQAHIEGWLVAWRKTSLPGIFSEPSKQSGCILIFQPGFQGFQGRVLGFFGPFSGFFNQNFVKIQGPPATNDLRFPGQDTTFSCIEASEPPFLVAFWTFVISNDTLTLSQHHL